MQGDIFIILRQVPSLSLGTCFHGLFVGDFVGLADVEDSHHDKTVFLFIVAVIILFGFSVTVFDNELSRGKNFDTVFALANSPALFFPLLEASAPSCVLVLHED